MHNHHTLVCLHQKHSSATAESHCDSELEFERVLVGSYHQNQTRQAWIFKIHCGNQWNVAYYLQNSFRFWQEILQHFTNEVSDSILISPPKKWKSAEPRQGREQARSSNQDFQSSVPHFNTSFKNKNYLDNTAVLCCIWKMLLHHIDCVKQWSLQSLWFLHGNSHLQGHCTSCSTQSAEHRL